MLNTILSFDIISAVAKSFTTSLGFFQVFDPTSMYHNSRGFLASACFFQNLIKVPRYGYSLIPFRVLKYDKVAIWQLYIVVIYYSFFYAEIVRF